MLASAPVTLRTPVVFRSTLPVLVLAAACWLHPADAAERPEDAAVAGALEQYAGAVTALECELLALAGIAPAEDGFDLYRTYNALLGAWVQVDRLQTLLDSMATTSATGEPAIRDALHEHLQFTLGQLDEAVADLDRDERPGAPRIAADVRSLLTQVRATIARYWLAVMPPST
jgi:hypothetical protein